MVPKPEIIDHVHNLILSDKSQLKELLTPEIIKEGIWFLIHEEPSMQKLSAKMFHCQPGTISSG